VGAARGELDISRVSGNVARAFCVALEPLLDMLASAGLLILAVRITLHPEQVSHLTMQSFFDHFSCCFWLAKID
jgi:hypothetical protein